MFHNFLFSCAKHTVFIFSPTKYYKLFCKVTALDEQSQDNLSFRSTSILSSSYHVFKNCLPKSHKNIQSTGKESKTQRGADFHASVNITVEVKCLLLVYLHNSYTNAFAANVDQDQTAQNMQSDLWSTLSVLN